MQGIKRGKKVGQHVANDQSPNLVRFFVDQFYPRLLLLKINKTSNRYDKIQQWTIEFQQGFTQDSPKITKDSSRIRPFLAFYLLKKDLANIYHKFILELSIDLITHSHTPNLEMLSHLQIASQQITMNQAHLHLFTVCLIISEMYQTKQLFESQLN